MENVSISLFFANRKKVAYNCYEFMYLDRIIAKKEANKPKMLKHFAISSTDLLHVHKHIKCNTYRFVSYVVTAYRVELEDSIYKKWIE